MEDNVKNVISQYSEHKTDNEIYHDLMQYKVKDILLVASLYDAFILEMEGRLNEEIFGEYHQLNLSSAPRINNVSSADTALNAIQNQHFDMVILTMRISDISPFELRNKIKEIDPSLPVLMLINDDAEVPALSRMMGNVCNFNDLDRIFVWNGDAKIFLAMIKYVEDNKNVEYDTKHGLVRVILLIEDSCKYYSQYLPILYTELMKQSQRLIQDEQINEINKLLKMRVRPKVLLASDYEQAVEIIDKYEDNLLCLISDIRFPRDTEMDDMAGFTLMDYAKKQKKGLPVLLQSSNPKNKEKALGKNAFYIDKNSETLISELRDFVYKYLGFGKFVFKDKHGVEIMRIESIDEFGDHLKDIPVESLIYHGKRNHFSTWFMARGEISIAKNLQNMQLEDFDNIESMRELLISSVKDIHMRKSKGKIIHFSEAYLEEEPNITRLREGSLGGKGRGLAFVNSIIQNSEMNSMFDNVRISIPRTSIIGTEEFEEFLELNEIHYMDFELLSDEEIKRKFITLKLSQTLINTLKKYLGHMKKPLAVRSSSIFEDSISQSFSGVYETYLLSNNADDKYIRLKQLTDAVKLIYASVFSSSARQYFKAINYRIEEERMAVIIQEVVGVDRDGKYYPHFSGVAQSYNYYPVSYIKPEDGITEIGVGLGKFVIDGRNAYRFCPKYPKVELSGKMEQIDASQKYFYAVNLNKHNFDLVEGEDATLLKLHIDEAKKDGTLDYIASVWDYQNERMEPGIKKDGALVINFDYILKYGYFPLSDIISLLMDVLKHAMGTPVEMEFAVDMNDNKQILFYVLQLKPIILHAGHYKLPDQIEDKKDILLFSHKAMGNGKIENVKNVLYVKSENFDKFKTNEIREEIIKFNEKMLNNGEKYILIGPGRWGSQDSMLGVPVIWSDICNARIVVETEIEGFRVDPSLGSHFFHNIISMNIGYFAVSIGNEDILDYKILKNEETLFEGTYIRHIRFECPLEITMDGMNGRALIKLKHDS